MGADRRARKKLPWSATNPEDFAGLAEISSGGRRWAAKIPKKIAPEGLHEQLTGSTTRLTLKKVRQEGHDLTVSFVR
jgi:hypothetical protein